MKKWTTVDTAPMPDGTTMSLIEHDGDWFVRVDGGELMSTRRHASEEKLAELACAGLANRRDARVLIGGLGFGFTLKAALAALPAEARVTMAEIQPAVVAWNRNPSFPLASEALKDPRVHVVEKDVAEQIRKSPGAFDAILLDVDNGPAALSTAGNRDLYSYDGLRRTHAALRPGGCAAFWSAALRTASGKGGFPGRSSALPRPAEIGVLAHAFFRTNEPGILLNSADIRYPRWKRRTSQWKRRTSKMSRPIWLRIAAPGVAVNRFAMLDAERAAPVLHTARCPNRN